MFEDFHEDEYSADPDVPVTSKRYERLRALYARFKARHLKFAHLAQLGVSEGWAPGKVAVYKRRAAAAARRAKRVQKKLEKERCRLEAMSSESGASMLAEQGAADESGHELLSVPVGTLAFSNVGPEEMDEAKAVAVVAGTSFGYIDYAQYDPKTQMLLDMGYELEDFSVDARLDAQLRQLEEMGISTAAHMSGDDDLYTEWPTLDYAVPSDVADAGMFSGDTDFLDSHAPVGLWEDGPVDQFESGDVSMGDAYGAPPIGILRHHHGMMMGGGKAVRRPMTTHSEVAGRRAVTFTRSESNQMQRLREQRKGLRKLIADHRKAQSRNRKATTVHSRKLARERRALKRERARLQLLRRWRQGPLKGKYKDPLRAVHLRNRIKKLAPAVRNSNKRLRKLNRNKAGIAQTILRSRSELAKVKGKMAAIRAAAHERAGNQTGKAEAQVAVVALDAVIKKAQEEEKVVIVAEEASDRLLEAQESADTVSTKEAELEVAVSKTDLKPESLGTPEIAQAEQEVQAATEQSGYSMAGIFDAIKALSDQMTSYPQGNPVYQENPEPIEAGEGGFIDVPEQWDAAYYEPEWGDEQGYYEDESVEFQQEAAQHAAPYPTDSGHSPEFDAQAARLDDQLAQLAALGVSISGDSYGVDPWDQFGDDLYEQWPTLDYAVPSDVADAGMFSGDGYGEAFGWTPGGSGIKLNWSGSGGLPGGSGSGAGAGSGAGSGAGAGDEAKAPKKKASVDDVMGVLGPLVSAGLNFAGGLINNSGKGNSRPQNNATNTANKMDKAATATQPIVITTPTPPPSAAEIAAEMERRSATAPQKAEANIWPWVGVGVAGVAVVGTAFWASTR